MRLFPLLLSLFLFVPSLVLAGEIRGTISEGSKPVGAGVSIDVRCGNNAYTATTDKFGSYRLFVPDKGTCALQVHYQNQSPSREIISFEDSTRYDLVLGKEGGQYVLRRQ